MTKQVNISYLIIAASLFLGGCASTDIEKRLEKNFVYQCSIKLLDEVDKKISGADAEKICAAAHKAELDEEARKTGVSPPSSTAAIPVATEAPSKNVTEAPVKASTAEADEVKPEPTPKN